MIPEKDIIWRLQNYENPQRKALSLRYPKLKKPIVLVRQTIRNIQNFFDKKIRYTKSLQFFPHILARHQSVLRRNLGESDPKLQEQKIINLQQAIKKLNGIIIEPGDIFSFWNIVGKPKYKDGYVDGMLLSNGKVVEGLAGGLCQLSNFLYWIFLHVPIETVERYHHSLDVFPDSGRTLPFGSGATLLYNFFDLKIKNNFESPIQLKLWLTKDHLKGQIVSLKQNEEKIHIFEQNHCFIKRGEKYFRYNEIYKEVRKQGNLVKMEKITTNFAPVYYSVTEEYLRNNHFLLFDINSHS